jgi:hypothetical protein
MRPAPPLLDGSEAAFIDADSERLNRVLSRVVRGLYRHTLGAILPATANVVAFPHDAPGFAEFLASDVDAVRCQRALPSGWKIVGEDAFAFRCVWDEDQPQASYWELRFYGGLYFTAVTAPGAGRVGRHSDRQ